MGEGLSGIKPQKKISRLLSYIKSLVNKDDAGIKETLENLLEEHEDREIPLQADERRLISNILKIGQKTVDDIMVPRSLINAIDVNMPLQKAVEKMTEKPHSRYPVYNNSLDNVVGMVHIKDVLSHIVKGMKPDLNDIMRNIIFVVPSMTVIDLMLKMQVEKLHIAVVVDEFGGVDGLVTIEDVVEEIVGNIDDEHDVERILFQPTEDGGAVIDARLELEELESKIGKILSDEERNEDIDTIGGLLVYILGRVAETGEVVTHENSGIKFVVTKSDPRRIKTIEIKKLPNK